MKKISFLIMLLVLSACTKKSTPVPVPDATVIYHFTGSTAASYQLRYSGSDGNPVSTTFTGTTWSKTITANKASGFTYAVFFISLTSPATVITGSADISVNGKISSQVPLTFNSGNGSTDLTFSAGVFK
ncbi:MAG TPA: hypothetical protein VK671_16280 [Mucilaginibacter sp.]|nr:hypothetical protein [Mucilaginibacter sp.]